MIRKLLGLALNDLKYKTKLAVPELKKILLGLEKKKLIKQVKPVKVCKLSIVHS